MSGGRPFRPSGLNGLGKAVVVGALLALILLVDHLGFFNGTDNHFYDLSFRIRGPAEAARNIVVVAIDDKSLEKLGRWPIDRRHYALALRQLDAADVVAFDLIMADPSSDDTALARAAEQHGRVVFPVAIDDRMYVTHPAFGFPRKHTGHIQVETGIDGIVRDVFHTLLVGDQVLHSFSSRAWEMATGEKLGRAAHDTSGGRASGIVQADRMAINYAGGPGTFERVSFSDVLDGVYPVSYFKDRVCIVGLTATGAAEVLLTPFSEERKGTPGVEIHANAVSTLMLGNRLRSTPSRVRWGVIVLVGLGCFFGFVLTSELRAAVLAAGACVAVAACVYVLFVASSVWFAPSALLAAVLSLFVTAYAFKFHDAVHRLDAAYRTVLSQLRRHGEPEGTKRPGQGVRTLLTPGGVSSKAEVLGDITDRLIFEKQLTDTAIFSDVHGVLLFGPDGACVLKNSLAAEACRENGIDTVSSGAFTDGLGRFGADNTDVQTALSQSFAGQQTGTFNVLLPLPQKKYFKVDVTPLAIQGETYTLVVFSDITTVKELELLKSEVVTLVSHEIKTPLASIQGFSEMLAESAEGDTKQYATIVRTESERLIRFLETFLDIARIEEGRQPITIGPVSIMEIAREVTQELSVIADANRIVLRLETPEGIAPAMADRDLAKQCIMNLVENAVKYSESGRDVVMRVAEEGDCIRMETIDSGIGIREDELGRVFEKFYRARSSGRKVVSGSGLGLAFVKQAVEAQGGTVSVKSRYGQGSTFSILLPKGTTGEGR